MAERKPWRCPECGGIVAPHVDVHWCGGPDGGVTANRPKRPVHPAASAAVVGEKGPVLAAAGGSGGVTTVMWTFPPGTTGTEIAMVSGRAFELDAPGPFTMSVALDGKTLFETLQNQTVLYNIRAGKAGGRRAA